MKNVILLIGFLIVMGLSVVLEPVSDTVDIIAGATNDTYNTQIDQVSGASIPHGDDNDDSHDETEDDNDESEDDD